MNENRDIADDVSEDEFIPYACHYDAQTLLTKNGELLQILRITTNAEGLDYEQQNGPTIRDALRDAISAHASSKRLAFWIHTLRRRQPLPPAPAFNNAFATRLHAAWRQAHPWEYSYTNEIYLSVLTEGDAVELFDKKRLYDNLFVARNRRRRESFLRAAHVTLEAAVNGVLSFLAERCNAKRLQIVARGGEEGNAPVYYSEPLEFLHFLINLEHAEMPVSDTDSAMQLARHELSFGFDALESRRGKSLRRFASILTVKGSPLLPPEAIDRCLQIPEALVVTQTFNFVSSRQALEKASAARELLQASPDKEMMRRCGLEALLKSDRGQATDFGEQQTSVMLIVDQFRRLDEALGIVQEAFAQQGLVTVREDMRLEDVFWSQLPGNFPFLCRRSPLPASRLGALARLNQFPTGSARNNHWGNALTVLPTLRGTPYFFNFHIGDIGHTALLDFNSFADERGALFLNFLLAYSRQYHGRLFVLDRGQASRLLIKSLGGRYEVLDGTETGLRLNPLQLEDSKRDRSFLGAWLLNCVHHDDENTEAMREIIRQALDEIFALPASERTLETALARLKAHGAE
ncbi:MAG: hypothetical protein JO089_07775, partial [Alphaproteobacteria bacterium]|nr:hypothetical protein [Alphaproteobacteria bacterium]